MKPNTPAHLMAQIAQLSPEKRALLELRLKEKLQGADNITSVMRREQRATAPLSFAQQRFWFLDQLEPDLPIYNEWTAVRLRGPLDIDVLEQSINEIVRRHESLRTTFALRDEQPVQMIAPVLTVPLPVIDLQGLPGTERWGEAKRLAMEETQRPFNLARRAPGAPLFRATLFQMAAQEYILLLTFHHIVIDAWSATILYRELGTLYAAFLQKQPSPLRELPVQYADFAVWQREWLHSGAFESQLAYWQKQLADLSPLQLPTDRPRPPKQSFGGGQQSILLSAALAASLNTLSRQAGASLFMTLLAAFQTLLHRYSGQDDIVIGSPIANRNRPEIEGLIGCFTNTLVLRSDFAGNPTFRTLLGRVRTTVLDALAHQELPFEKLVEELQPQRDVSSTPLFQVLFVFNNTALNFNQFGAVQADPLDFASTIARFDLTLSVTELETGLQAHLAYNTDLFDPATIDRMISHLQTLLASIVADPDQRIGRFPLLTEVEYHQIVHEWNGTTADYPTDKYIHHLFEEQVERTPDAVAVISPQSGVRSQVRNSEMQDAGGRAQDFLTYAELNARANQLAHLLQSLGVGPDSLVGLCVERSPAMLIGLLGILKAGGGYVPFDPTYPAERLAYMVGNANIQLLLTTELLRSQLTWADGVRCLINWTALNEQSEANPTSCVKPENLVYCLYTSGSTGVSKGVLMPHRAISNLIQWQLGYTTVAGQAHTLQFAPLNFDVSCQEIFATLCAGGALVLIDEERRRDPAALLRYLEATAVERLYLPFVALQQLAEVADGHMPACLREVNTAGEQLQITYAIANWFRDSGCRLQNHYGPTETHVVTACQLPPCVEEWPALPSIGRPIANSRIYILDSAMQPAPLGIVGELYVGGPALAHGYCQRPDLTAERFVDNPFGQGALYRTGDLCRWLPVAAGGPPNIEYIGRTDFQVKIRGFRIELGEIESALLAQAGVREAVVLVREDRPGDKRLIAYLVGAIDPAILRQGLAQRLPAYMLPAAFVTLEAMPLTPNGKLDRRALPAPVAVQPSLAETFAPPSTPTEECVAAIWCEVLRLEQVGIHDDFFALGGHSLLATQVISRCREAFQVEVALLSLFEERTIAGLAGRIEQRQLTQALQQTLETASALREEIAL